MNVKKNDNKGGMRNYEAPLPEMFPPPESHRPTLIGEQYMVVAGHPLVAQVAPTGTSKALQYANESPTPSPSPSKSL